MKTRGAGAALILAAAIFTAYARLGVPPPGIGNRTLYNFVVLLMPLVPLLVTAGVTALWIRAGHLGWEQRAGYLTAGGTATGTLLLFLGFAGIHLTGGEGASVYRELYDSGLLVFLLSLGLHGLLAWQAQLVPRWATGPLPIAAAAELIILWIIRSGGQASIVSYQALVWASIFMLALSWTLLGAALLFSRPSRRPALHE